MRKSSSKSTGDKRKKQAKASLLKTLDPKETEKVTGGGVVPMSPGRGIDAQRKEGQA